MVAPRSEVGENLGIKSKDARTTPSLSILTLMRSGVQRCDGADGRRCRQLSYHYKAVNTRAATATTTTPTSTFQQPQTASFERPSHPYRPTRSGPTCFRPPWRRGGLHAHASTQLVPCERALTRRGPDLTKAQTHPERLIGPSAPGHGGPAVALHRLVLETNGAGRTGVWGQGGMRWGVREDGGGRAGQDRIEFLYENGICLTPGPTPPRVSSRYVCTYRRCIIACVTTTHTTPHI